MLRQLAGMARYEALMHWRRRGLPLVMTVWLLATFGFSWLITEGGLGAGEPLPVDSVTLRRLSVTMLALATSAGPAIIFGGIVLAVLASETLPLEWQWNVQEWLHALPLGPGAYLAGKVGGLWVLVAAGTVFNGLAWGLGLRLLHGAYDLGLYLQLWGTLVLPLALYISALSALLPAGLRRRPVALLVGIAVAVASYGLLVPLLFEYVRALYGQLMVRSFDQVSTEVCRASAAACSAMAADLHAPAVPVTGLWAAAAGCAAALGLAWLGAWLARRRGLEP